jgi:hypothetical protein
VIESAEQFACLNGHRVTVWLADGSAADLNGFLCPVCLGQVKGFKDIIDPMILSAVQVIA